MLQYIRDLTAGWIALVILGLFCVPFVFWGANFYFGDPPNPIIAKVGERELTRDAFRTSVDRYRRELGASELSVRIRDEALDRMIDGGLILAYTKGRRMHIADVQLSKEIGQLFGGNFDIEEYQQWLQQRGLSETDFENQMRQDMLARQLQDAVAGSVFLLDDELRRLARAELQERDFAYVRISADEEAVEEPDAEAIQAYYDEHPESYTLPEQVRIAYLELNLEKIAEQLTVDEEELQAFYESRAADYNLEEERKLTVIHLPLPEDHEDRETAGLLMQHVRARAEAGEILEDLVTETDLEKSDDTEAEDDPETTTEAAVDGDTSKGEQTEEDTVADSLELDPDKEQELMGRLELVDRNFVTRGGLPADQAEALFTLAEEGALSAVLEDAAGVRILRLDEVKEGRISTFENSREDAEVDYREVEAERRFIEQAERLGILTFESPNSLDPAAEALGLDIQESTPFSRNRGDPGEPSAEPAVRAAAFSEDVLELEENSPLLELGDARVMVVRLTENIPESLQPLAEVQERLLKELKREAARDGAYKQGEDALQRLQSGEDRTALEALEWAEHTATRDDREILRAALREAFRMPAADSEPVYSGQRLGNGDYLLVALTAVRNIEDDTEIPQEKLDEVKERLSDTRYLLEWREFLKQVREQQDIEIHTELVEQTWTDLQS